MAETPENARSNRPIWLFVALLTVIVVVAANAHLAYLAVSTQPLCVPHAKEKGVEPGQYQAAKSDC